jgi:hypothetical protein
MALVTTATAMATTAAATILALNVTRPEPTIPSTPQVSTPVLQGKTVADVQTYAQALTAEQGWGATQFVCLRQLWTRESGWLWDAENASGSYGIAQALPGSKMASAGADWQTNPATQVKWGLSYIKSVYGTPCGAWGFEVANGYY